MVRMRPLLPLLWILSLLAWTVTGTARADNPVSTLRVVAWPGYADPDVVKAFERKHGVRVELSMVGSDELLWQKISANEGGDFDVFAVNTAELQRYLNAGLVQPVDPNAIPNTHRQLPRFRNLGAIAGLTRDGTVFGIPYTYAEMGLIYDRNYFAQPPDSIAALWDPSLRGRVVAYNGGGHNFSLAALSLGRDTPFRLDEADWPKAVSRLIELRRNVLAFYREPEEATHLFREHHAVLLFANYGSQQVQALRTAGADIGYAIPREGALAWLDCWVIARGARNIQLVNAWIDYMLEGTVSGLLTSRQGLSNTITEAPGNNADRRLIWLEPMEDPARRERLWARIISGDRAERVLAP